MYYVDGIGYDLKDKPTKKKLKWFKISERGALPIYSLGFCANSNEYRFDVRIESCRSKKIDSEGKRKYFYTYTPRVYDWITDKNYAIPGKKFINVEDAKQYCGETLLKVLDELNASLYEGRNQ